MLLQSYCFTYFDIVDKTIGQGLSHGEVSVLFSIRLQKECMQDNNDETRQKTAIYLRPRTAWL